MRERSVRSSVNELRRALLVGAGALTLPGMAACSLFRKPAVPRCPNDPALGVPGGPLTIDVHAHVFNASDLQVRRFIELVLARQDDGFGEAIRDLAGLLQNVGWDVAPTAEEELVMLRRLRPELEKCNAREKGRMLGELRESAYRAARVDLNEALDRTGRRPPRIMGRSARELSAMERRLPSRTAQADFLVRNLPESREEYLRQREARLEVRLSDRTVQGAIDFVIQNFQYRYVSVHDYLETYARAPSRSIDLLIAHMVDYDWWLANGESTRTPVKDQVRVMEEISLLTAGRVHGFVPFDPLREVASRKLGGDSSLRLAQDAVRHRGCIGVKIYPPMGFAAWGNDGRGLWQGRDWLPDLVRRDDFEKELDAAMGALLTWARDEQVPIMAHTSLSNGVIRDFEMLAGAEHWKRALDQFDRHPHDKLRVNFGHFGDTELVQSGPGHAEGFVDLMSEAPGAPGARAYADASYFSDALNRMDPLVERLKALYVRRDGILAKRLMYGSDWVMSLVERNVESYLGGFENVYARLQRDLSLRGPRWQSLADDFFGRNAVDYLGLRKGEPSRKRLDAFYEGRGATPVWMAKVDAL